MAAIYAINTGNELCSGLQGCYTCDEAIRAAQSKADRLGQDVHLVDDDGDWVVHPAGPDGTRRLADPIDGDDGRDD